MESNHDFQGLGRRQVPYGMIVHFFKNMSNENIWSSVMWEGWYRVYAAPDRKTVDKFILALKSWLEKRNPFAFCFVADKAVMDAKT